MSFTTRCPACGTTFRIVPDQLKISDGWVRCGHCSDVFDATLFLEGEEDTPLPAGQPVSPAKTVEPPLPEPPQAVQSQPMEVSAATPAIPVEGNSVPADDIDEEEEDEDWLVPPSLPQQDELNEDAPDSSMPAAMDPSFLDELRQFERASLTAGANSASDLPVSDASPQGLAIEEAEQEDELNASKPPVESSKPELLAEEEDDLLPPAEPSFVRQARRKAFWQSRGMQIGQVLVSLSLLVALLVQVLVHERDRVAAAYPPSRAVLTALCRAMDCTIGPVRQIESVAIDSSNLVRRLDNFYAFDLVLRNGADVAVAVPALELSLTDSRDAVITRRVFLPQELPGSPDLLPPKGSLSLSLRLSIADKDQSTMSGYRALVFYH